MTYSSSLHHLLVDVGLPDLGRRELPLHVLNVNGRVDRVFRALRTDVNESVFMVCNGCWVEHLIEAHHVRDHLFVNVSLSVVLD